MAKASSPSSVSSHYGEEIFLVNYSTHKEKKYIYISTAKYKNIKIVLNSLHTEKFYRVLHPIRNSTATEIAQLESCSSTVGHVYCAIFLKLFDSYFL